MKKFILMLIFVLGSFIFAEITDKDVESFVSPKTQVYVSNQKDWFYGMYPADEEETTWKKINFFINVLPVGNKYKISYTPFGNVESYDKEGYPVLIYKIDKEYVDGEEKDISTTDSYEITILGLIHSGTEIKNGKKYTRSSYQVLSKNELDTLLKSKNAKRLDSSTEKNTKEFLNWLFHNAN